MIITDSAYLWCFAARRSATRKGHSLAEYRNAAAGHHRDALRVSLSTPTDCAASLGKGVALTCETRLAACVDKLTESVIIMLEVH
ncbi:MAG: hypothetical protein KJP11_02515 [Gammaproteobacteria bacterium]|nr:hypothetical protein [Gammaproteobacteria bacterium]